MIRKVWLFLKALPGNLRKLFTSLSFLRIRNSDLFFFQWFLPSCIAIVAYVVFLGPFGFPFEFDHQSIFHGINGLVGILIGFYIAALAATATFPNEKLDNELSGSKNIIRVRRKGI